MSSPANRPPNAVPTAAPAPTARAATAAAPAAAPISTPELLTSMLRTAAKVSDLFFSPGKPPLVEINGKLTPAGAARPLTSEDTRRIAADLIGNNQHATDNLKQLGSCDVSYSLPGSNRFRVNIFMQRGTCAVVMRVIPGKVPDFESLNLPSELGKIVELRNGIVLVTGPHWLRQIVHLGCDHRQN
jgi:twitching motility protein PilT